MDASREKAPSPQETFVQMAQAAGLRGRVLVTLGLLILARFGTFIPVPGSIDSNLLQTLRIIQHLAF
jgi:preprotein translocase subunit SecY